MRKFFYLFLITLVVIVTSIAYMGNYDQFNHYEKYKLELFASSARDDADTSSSKYNYLISYPHVLSCNTNYSSMAGIDHLNKENFNYSQPADNSTHSTRITRAIVVYFPIEKNENFEPEFKWMYRSWIEMQMYEPSKWRTDIVVFINTHNDMLKKEDFFLNKLNCSVSNRRREASDEPMCTLVAYTPFKQRLIKRFNPKNEKNNYDYLLKNVDIFSDNKENLKPFYSFLKRLSNYGYLDSILMAFDGYNYFKSAGYNFLIRSDMDVFLTPLFGMWLPHHCNDFYVGRGGYSANFNTNRLKRIASNIGFEHASEINLGSTWYSTPDQFRLVSYLTLFGMAYLSEEEFSKPEREGKLGVLLWPYWHYGVLLLYGQNLALNHLIATNQLNVIKLEQHLDYPSYFNENIFKVLHIHVFHGDDMFSKFQFKAGKYDNMNPNLVDTNISKYYSLKMALAGKRMTSTELAQLFLNETQKRKF